MTTFGERVNLYEDPSVMMETIVLKELEASNDDVFVILSDVWLNEPRIIAKLKALFEGFKEAPPFCFIFMGNFVSSPAVFYGSDKRKYGRMLYLYGQASHSVEYFDILADLIAEHETILERSQFVFIPGALDGFGLNILPYPKIPDVFIRKFKNKVPKSTFASNPCRYVSRIFC